VPPVRALSILAAAAAAAVLLAGCGSSKPAASTLSPQQYAKSVVNQVLRPLTRDLGVLNALNTPDVKLYLLTAQPTTIRILKQRLVDLRACTSRLDRVGAPPPRPPAFPRIDAKLRSACDHYGRVAAKLLDAVTQVGSTDPAVKRKGTAAFSSVFAESKQASLALRDAVTLMQAQPAFRRAGVRTG
jgi:hypothetical protein